MSGTPDVALDAQRFPIGRFQRQAEFSAEQRKAHIAQIAALALSGLAGILGMTALGGFLGYRQAKVGYMLRAGGIARFLQ